MFSGAFSSHVASFSSSNSLVSSSWSLVGLFSLRFVDFLFCLILYFLLKLFLFTCIMMCLFLLMMVVLRYSSRLIF